MRGKAVPQVGRLKVLISWLGLNADEFLGAVAEPNPLPGKVGPAVPRSENAESMLSELVLLANRLDRAGVKALITVAGALSTQGRNGGH